MCAGFSSAPASPPDEAEDELELEWHYSTGDPTADREAEQLRHRRAELELANRDLAKRTSELARRLVTVARFSVQEAAALLSISPARVDQMLRESQGRRPSVAS